MSEDLVSRDPANRRGQAVALQELEDLGPDTGVEAGIPLGQPQRNQEAEADRLAVPVGAVRAGSLDAVGNGAQVQRCSGPRSRSSFATTASLVRRRPSITALRRRVVLDRAADLVEPADLSPQIAAGDQPGLDHLGKAGPQLLHR